MKNSIPKTDYLEIADLYESVLADFPYVGEMYQKIIEEIKLFFNRKSNVTVLELGFGTGILTEKIASLGDRIKIVGVDHNDCFYAKAKNRLTSYNNVTLIKGNAIGYINNKCFDIVVSTFTYHHIPDYAKQNFIKSNSGNLCIEGKAIIGDEFIDSFINKSEKRESIKDFYQKTTAYLRKNRTSAGTLDIFDQSFKNSLEDVEEYKTSVNILKYHLKKANLKYTKSFNIWPKRCLDYGCKIIIAEKQP